VTAAAAAAPGRRARLAAVAAPAAVLLHALLRLPPWWPRQLGPLLDPSWEWTYHEAWLRGWVCGRDLQFTYGPWGFVPGAYYHPGTFAAMLAVHALLVALTTLAAWSLLRGWSGSPWKAAAWTAAWVETIRVFLPGQTMFAHLALLLLVAHFGRREGREGPREARAAELRVHLLAAGAALAALFKFTLFLGALAALVPVVAERVLLARRWPWAGATFAGALLLAWLAAGQPPDALPAYLSSSAAISSGYSEAMGFPGPVLHLALFVPACALVLGLLGRATDGRGRAARGLFLAGLLGQAFLLWKSAFVRHDWHAVIAPATLLPWLVLGLACAGSRRPGARGRIVLAASAASVLALAHVVFAEVTDHGLPGTFAASLRAWPGDARDAARAVLGRTSFAAGHEAALELIRREYPLPPVAGMVDVYPTTQALALAHGMDYRPRPVIQSYCAFTGELARRNAEHLAGPGGPEHVLFAIIPVDQRYPALEDGLSWPVLLSRYDVQGVHSRHALLRRSPTPRVARLTPASRGEIRFGSQVKLPETPPGTLLWARIGVDATPAGRAATFLLRPPVVLLTVRLRDGAVRAFRLVPELARAGFLLSPLVGNAEDFARVARAGTGVPLAAYDVLHLGVSGADTIEPSYAYEPACTLELSVLEFLPAGDR